MGPEGLVQRQSPVASRSIGRGRRQILTIDPYSADITGLDREEEACDQA